MGEKKPVAREEEKFIFVRKHWDTSPSGRTVGNCRTAEEKEREGGREGGRRKDVMRNPKNDARTPLRDYSPLLNPSWQMYPSIGPIIFKLTSGEKIRHFSSPLILQS